MSDHEMRIKFVDGTYPGASHDSFMCKRSDYRKEVEKEYLQNGRNMWLLGSYRKTISDLKYI